MSVRITECPRDAMQGIHSFIPTEKKIAYINSLLRVGFDTIDFGSFVSPKAIPQMSDTAQVLDGLELEGSRSKLLAIVANTRGASDACQWDQINYLGYPFSISETFQQRNTNASIDQSLSRVEAMQDLCQKNGKTLLIYISMAFGNPYGDPWSPELAANWMDRLSQELSIRHFAMADTVGVSNPTNINDMFGMLIPAFENAHIAAHLHSLPYDAPEKINAAYQAGCRSFDAALNGLGGCPMAEDELVGNVATEQVIETLSKKENLGLDLAAFERAKLIAQDTFPK
jgi:hydroxymethylglutaryl-CoA lyase